MTELDLNLFRLINDGAGHNSWLDAFGIFAAHWLIWLMVVVLLAVAMVPIWKSRRGACHVCLIFGRGKHRRQGAPVRTAYAAIIALLAAGLAWIGNQMFALLVVSRVRPFVSLSHVHRLIDPPLTAKSFPSDHSTAAFALAFSLTFMRPGMGVLMLAAAALVAWGRVFVGVHFPSDVAAGALVGFFWALIAKLVESRTNLTRRLCRLYESICHRLVRS